MRKEIKRTVYSKLFSLGGNKYHLRTGIKKPLHYVGKGRKLLDIDLTPTEERGFSRIDKAPYSLLVNNKYPEYRYTSGANSVSVKLKYINDNGISERFSEYKDGNFIWRGISFDIDCTITPLNGGVRTILVLHSANAPRSFKWEILGKKDLLKPIRGWDAGGNPLDLNQEWDGDCLIVKWSGRALSKKTARKGAPYIDPKFPVKIDPSVNEHVAGADDVSTFSSSIFSSSTTIIVSHQVAGYVNGGFLFRTIAVPKGAAISSATLTLNLKSTNVGTFKIYGNDTDSASTWSSGNPVQGMPKTTANATLAPTTSTTDSTTGLPYSIGVTGIVQEIISRPGWSSNNNMGFGVFPPATTGVGIKIGAYEHASIGEAQLDITYSMDNSLIFDHKPAMHPLLVRI